MIKIVIADDHTVLREGLKALIELNPKWKVVDQASDGLQVLTSIEQHKPDILILDLTMPKLGGLEVINRLRQTNYIPRILILSAKDDNISAVKSLQAGANGFIPKKSSTDEIEFAIKAVLRGQIYLSPEVASDLINKQLNREIDSPLELLSSREREVLKLICEGYPNREVAKILRLSPKTIDSHRSNILKKMNCKSNTDLVQLAAKYGLTEK